MIPVLYPKNERQFSNYGMGMLHDAQKVRVRRERNGQYIYYMEYPLDGKYSQILTRGLKIKADAGARTKWQTFEVSRVRKVSTEHIEVFAHHITQRTEKMGLNPHVRIQDANGQRALELWRHHLVGDDTFDVWSDIQTVASTEWRVDQVANAREALGGVAGSILDRWGGEYEFDNMTIRLHSEMGRQVPIPLEYGRNILSVEEDDQDESVYTSVYPYAQYTEEGDTAPKIITLAELYVDGKYVEMYESRKIQVVDFTDEFGEDEVPTAARLNELARQYLDRNEVGAPRINTKVEYIDLAKTLDYEAMQTMEEVELNDRIPIYYPDFGITNDHAKVVVIEYDPTTEENVSIELGVVGQSFGKSLTSGIEQRLENVERQQQQTAKYVMNSQGNRIWYETPTEDMEHNFGDVWFEKNGLYTRLRVWNGSQWIVEIDTEDVDKIMKEVQAAQQTAQEAKAEAEAARTDAITEAERLVTEQSEQWQHQFDTETDALRQSITESHGQALTEAKSYTDEKTRQWQSEFSDETRTIRDEVTSAYERAVGEAEQYTNTQKQATDSALATLEGEVSTVKTSADRAVSEIDTAIRNAGFSSLDDTVQSVQSAHQQALTSIESLGDSLLSQGSSIADIEQWRKTVDADMAETAQIAQRADDFRKNADNWLAGVISERGLVDGTWVEQNIDEAAGELDRKITKIEGDFEGMEIGARNLVIRTGEKENHYINANGADQLSGGKAIMKNLIKVTPGEKLTFTKIDSTRDLANGYWRWKWLDADESYISGDSEASNEFTWTVPEGAYFIQVSYPMDSQPKIERGTISTGFTLSPEDQLSKQEFSVFENSYTETVDRIERELTSFARQEDLNGLATEAYARNYSEQTAEGVRNELTSLINQKVDDTDFNEFYQNEYVRTAERVSDTYTRVETRQMLDEKADVSALSSYITQSRYERDSQQMSSRFTAIEQSKADATEVDALISERIVELNEGIEFTLDGYATTSYVDNQVTETAEGITRELSRVEELIPSLNGYATQAYASNVAAESADEVRRTLTLSINEKLDKDAWQSFYENQFRETAGAVERRIWQEDIQTELDDLEIGGRNLLRNTSEEWRPLHIGQWGATGSVNNGLPFNLPLENLGLRNGDTITYSVDVKDVTPTNSIRLRFDWVREDDTYVWTTGAERIENGRYSITRTIPEDPEYTKLSIRIMPRDSVSHYGYDIMARRQKLEKGNKATDFSFAPEDQVTQTEFESYQVQTAELLASKVSNDDYESFTIQTAEALRDKVESDVFASYQEQTDRAIKQMVQSEDFETYRQQTDRAIQDRVTGSDFATQVNQLDNAIQAKASQINKIDRASIKNLFPEGDFKGAHPFSNSGPHVSTTMRDGEMSAYLSESNPTTHMTDNRFWANLFFESGLNYAISLKVHSALDGQQISIGQSVSPTIETFTLRAGWQTISFTYKATNGYAFSIFMHHRGTYLFKDVSVFLSGAVSQKEMNDFVESQINLTHDMIDLRVQKDELISQINVQAGQTLISSNKILLDGDTYILGNAFIEDIQTNALTAVRGDIADLRTRILTTDVVRADHIRVDNALVNKLTANTAVLDWLFSRTAFIDRLHTQSLNAVTANIGTIRSQVLVANVVEANHLKVDNALIDRIFTNTAVMDRLFSRTAFIERLDTQYLSSIGANISWIITSYLKSDTIESRHLKVDSGLFNKLFANEAFINRIVTDDLFAQQVKSIDISADRITTGTINTAVANSVFINASSAAIGSTNFIRSAWNHAAGGNVQIDGYGVRSTSGNGSQAILQNGVFLARSPNGSTNGYIGVESSSYTEMSMVITRGSNFRMHAILDGGRTVLAEVYPGSSETYIHTRDTRVNQLIVNGGLDMRSNITMNDNYINNVNQVNFSRGGYIDTNSVSELRLNTTNGFRFIDSGNITTLIASLSNYRFYRNIVLDNDSVLSFANGGQIWSTKGSSLTIESSADVYLYSRGHRQIGLGNRINMYRTLSMGGNSIINQSDERIKEHISATEIKSLEAVKSWRIVGFNYLSGKGPQGRQLGVIAQETPDLAVYDAQTDTWNIDSSKQIMMNSHAIQMLADHTDTELDKAKKRIKELENKVDELERKSA